MARAILFWLEEVRCRALSDASFDFKLESIWGLNLKSQIWILNRTFDWILEMLAKL